MEQKKALNRKKLKVILVICIVMIVTAGIGLAVYIHHVDTVTLGRKVSVYRLDVSKLTVEEAQQKISEAFQNRTDFFQDYPEDTCLAAMMTCNECKGANPIEPIEDKGILEKIDRLVSEKISTIHVGVCRLPDGKHECPRMTQICNMIEERGIKVVRGTHKE